jgi:hypothetical protein
MADSSSLLRPETCVSGQRKRKLYTRVNVSICGASRSEFFEQGPLLHLIPASASRLLSVGIVTTIKQFLVYVITRFQSQSPQGGDVIYAGLLVRLAASDENPDDVPIKIIQIENKD